MGFCRVNIEPWGGIVETHINLDNFTFCFNIIVYTYLYLCSYCIPPYCCYFLQMAADNCTQVKIIHVYTLHVLSAKRETQMFYIDAHEVIAL